MTTVEKRKNGGSLLPKRLIAIKVEAAMVPYVDVMLTANLTKALKGIADVVFASPDVARQGLIKRVYEEKENLPGVTVFRTASEPDDSQTNMYVKSRGYDTSYNDDHSKLITTRHKPVKSRYSLSCFARKLTELHNIERVLQFFDVYAPIILMYEGQKESFFLEIETPIYIPWSYPDNGSIYGYRMDLEMTVATAWVLSEEWNTVKKIITEIHSIALNGEIITDKTLTDIDAATEKLSTVVLIAGEVDESGEYSVSTHISLKNVNYVSNFAHNPDSQPTARLIIEVSVDIQ